MLLIAAASLTVALVAADFLELSRRKNSLPWQR